MKVCKQFRPGALLLSMILTLTGAWAAGLSAAEVRTLKFEIEAGDATKALNAFGRQSGLQMFFEHRAVEGKRTKAVSGTLEPAAALAAMLRESGLTFEFINGHTVAIRFARPDDKASGGSDPADQMRLMLAREGQAPPQSDSGARETAQVVVEGERTRPEAPTGNIDLPRTTSDAQAYFIFDEKTLSQSGATSLSEFLRNRLTMNTNPTLPTQTVISGGGTGYGNVSNITLRGLAADETLILVNGRRQAPRNVGINSGNPLGQPDLNGIPLSAVERIEVLPASAAGIYGGGAVGGVVNVILKRDYRGTELRLVYANPFDTDAPQRNVDLSAGFSFDEGRTQAMFTASYADAGLMLFRDRAELFQRGLERVLRNSPSNVYSQYNPFLGATPNIVSADGSNLELDDGTSLGSPITFVPAGYAGSETDGGLALLPNAGRFNLDFARTNQAPTGLASPLGMGPAVKSAGIEVRRHITDRMQMFVNYSRSVNTTEANFDAFSQTSFVRVAADAPGNPFRQAVNVTVPMNIDLAYSLENIASTLVSGVVWALPRQWRIEADYTRGRSEGTWRLEGISYNAAFQAQLDSGAINPLRDLMAAGDTLDLSPYTRDIRRSWPAFSDIYSLRAMGSAFSLPWGQVTLATSAEHRTEGNFDSYSRFGATPSGGTAAYVTFYPEKSQQARSLYTEVTVPLFTEVNARRALRALDLQLSGRRDLYEVSAATAVVTSPGTPIVRSRSRYASTNPTVGIRWRPVEDLMIRASYSQGFRPPGMGQLLPPTSSPPTGSVIDRRRGNAPTTGVITLSGGNPDLLPETTQSLAYGIVWEPSAIEGLRLSLDYAYIRKDDAISSLPRQDIVDLEAIYPERVIRAAPTPGDPYGVGRILSVNTSSLNLNRTEVEAFDISATYRLRTARMGTFEWYSLSTLLNHVRRQNVANGPFIEQVNGPGGQMLKFKGNAGVTWELGPWSAGWNARYTPPYRVYAFWIAAQGGPGVPSQTYHDAFAGYRFENGDGSAGWHRGLLDGTNIQIGIKNVFGTVPPFDVGGAYYYSPYGDQRLREYSVSLRMQF